MRLSTGWRPGASEVLDTRLYGAQFLLADLLLARRLIRIAEASVRQAQLAMDLRRLGVRGRGAIPRVLRPGAMAAFHQDHADDEVRGW